ncbi:MAG: molybdopterin-dependent oxidoreductase, partial [Gemmatimonadetes bacterium]|nr:molybdopterin-dependent oxidoreductase [Gemmatimonadota bacterium]
RLAHSFGSPHYLTESSCCFGAGSIAAAVTLGEEYRYYLGPSRERYPETRCRLVWSKNPTHSRLPYEQHHLMTEASRVPTIVVDPRRTPLAEVAHLHLRLRPGTDGALAHGLAHVILEENLEDGEFLKLFAYGLDRYREYVRRFTPEETAQITGVAPEAIVAAARLYATTRPGQTTISASSTTHHSNGFQNHRAIILLSALCGNLDVAGGNRPWGHRVTEASLELSPEEVERLGPPLGSDRFPLFVERYGEGQAMVLADAIEAGEIRAVFGIGMNVMMWPNSGRLRRALSSLDFFSVADFFPTPTVDLATTFFPAATHLERQALVVSGDGTVRYRPTAVPPLADARGDTELVFQLAAHLGLGALFWDGDIHASYTDRLRGIGLSFRDLPRDGHPVQVELDLPPERAYLEEGFGTPTGKVEFVSTALEKAGYAGLPEYREPEWSPVSTPDLVKEYPLVLTSGARSANYTHSQGRQLETLRSREPEPLLQLNPADAEVRGIHDSDMVSLLSPVGAITLKARVTEEVSAGVVHAPHGWAGADVNEVIPDDELDPISGYPPFKSSLCEVRPAE